MTIPAPLEIAPTELLYDRPFTAPSRTAADFVVLEQIRVTLRATLRSMPDDHRRGDIVFPQDPSDLSHRVVVLDRGLLLNSVGALAVVGFFGQRRPGADVDAMEELDLELVDELRSHPMMLSYCSRELPDGGWANMVLLADPQGANSWRESTRHAYAARKIAPGYYETIRIHNGILPYGLNSPNLIHTRTSYYDFTGDAWWQAVRGAISAELLDAWTRNG